MPQNSTAAPQLKPKPIVFTDLDGTLLDLHTYSFAESLPGLRALQNHSVPVVFASSKTFAEQRHLQQQLGVHDPLIAENGSAIFVPEGYFGFEFAFDRHRDGYRVIELGVAAERIHAILQDIRTRQSIQFTCFAELSVAELQQHTGLDAEAAKQAQLRDYSETVIAQWNETEWRQFRQALQKRGLACHPGGRFYTVASQRADKGRAIRILSELYRQQFGAIRTVGIGDSPNDVSLFEAVDDAYLVQRPDGTWLDVPLPSIRRIDGIGPHGWLKVASELLVSIAE
ncbi:MAG: mannosyl-3-phosphoglycerate phosphatase [candidate division KSB1 bacterium]|nr:mannosyl-3-phosphoglycerate phosphatase [candidate division KSB1 bacterium]MDQ7065570.1 mannosyl-3-phosphoglycerate phosphatase [candidate division KSB1 bacterium]